MGVEEISSIEDFNAKINGDTPVLIDFWAEWCGPCRFISPFFGELSEKSENIKFYKVDVDSQKAISEAAGIRAMPTFQIYQKGEKVGELVGAVKPQLEALVVQAQSLAGLNENPDASSAPAGAPADPEAGRV